MEDIGPLVVTGADRPGFLEPIDVPLDLVATSVVLLIEPGGLAVRAAAALVIGSLVPRLRDRVLDLASSQVAPVAAKL